MGDQAKRTRVEHLPAEELTLILGQLGHEVGTPLGSLLMMAEMMADGATEPGLRRRAEGMKQAATEIRDVVQPFVRLVRLRTGWLGPESAEVRGEDVARAMAAGAESAGMFATVAGSLPEGRVDLSFLRDATELCCAWAAGQPSQAGATMEVGAEAAGGPIRCELRCPGDGIPWDQAAILDPLAAGDLVICRRHGGAGLQLALARMLVWRLGGELTGRFDETAGVNVLTMKLPLSGRDPLG